MKHTVSIKYFSLLADITGMRHETLQINKGEKINEIMDTLTERFPRIAKYRKHIRVAVNQEYVEFDFQPADKDEIVFITPVSGG